MEVMLFGFGLIAWFIGQHLLCSVLVFIHEMGHALAARSLGVEFTSIRVGEFVKRCRTMRFLGIPIKVYGNPFSFSKRFAYVNFTESIEPGRKTFVFSSTGPLLALSFLALLLSFSVDADLPLLAAIVLAAVSRELANLLPIEAGRTRSDGMFMLLSAFSPMTVRDVLKVYLFNLTVVLTQFVVTVLRFSVSILVLVALVMFYLKL